MKKVGEKCNLSDLKIGQKAIVKKLNFENKEIRRHLLDMGVTRGVQVKVKKIAPFDIELNFKYVDYLKNNNQLKKAIDILKNIERAIPDKNLNVRQSVYEQY